MRDRKIDPLAGSLSSKVYNKGIYSFSDLCQAIRHLAYGRLPGGKGYEYILDLDKGTCSTKHAFIKQVATEQGWHELKLLLCIYKMNASNTPGIGSAIKPPLTYIPEAHCILQDEEKRLDLTNPESDYNRIVSEVLLLKEIMPDQIGEWKVAFHKEFIEDWVLSQKIELSPSEVLEIREMCIVNLSNMTT